MSSYVDFSRFYDILTQDVDYKKRTDYLCKIFKKYGKMPTLLLDLACGTGGFSLQFAKKNMQVIGVDASENMLSVAQEKCADEGVNILFLCQKAENLDLYGTVDGAVCCLDSLNHITDYKALTKALSSVSLFLEKDSLFIFDVNTEYKHSTILGNNTFVREAENIFCVWQNTYNSKKHLTEIGIDFFEHTNDMYSRFTERFFERAYTGEELERALKSANLKVEAIFDELTFNSPKPESERLIYVTRRV